MVEATEVEAVTDVGGVGVVGDYVDDVTTCVWEKQVVAVRVSHSDVGQYL